MPYPPFNAPVPYPEYTSPGPSNAPSYPLCLTNNPPDVTSNLPTEGDQLCWSPSDDGTDVRYPSIAEFFSELMETESTEHHFTDYTEFFHHQGYYRVDQLADECLTVGHMVEIIEHLKEGTARVLKNKALDRVKKLRKGKGKGREI